MKRWWLLWPGTSCRPAIMTHIKKERMRNFSGAEIEVFLVEGGVEKNILFSSVSSGVTDTGKSQTRKEVTDAVNCVSSVCKHHPRSSVKMVQYETWCKNAWIHKKIRAAAGGGCCHNCLRRMSALLVSLERLSYYSVCRKCMYEVYLKKPFKFFINIIWSLTLLIAN